VKIRLLRRHSEFLQAEQLQRTVWRFPWREVIPLNELVVAQKNGGCVFGAFEGARLAAFCFGVPGFRDGRVYHYSRMLGVLPGTRDKGLGTTMKLWQRDWVLAQGLDLVRWTFDPLQARNAFLNIEKLGCIVRDYYVNIYGTSGSRFNAGLETDRFSPEWWLRSKRVKDAIAGKRRHPTLAEALAAKAHVEIPDDIDALKKRDLKAAQRARAGTRRQFLDFFKRGYAVTGFATGMDGARRRSVYILDKNVRP
jgi:predicted GNAT superfamily acetyltransferase